MRLAKSIYLPIAVVAILTGCKDDSDPSTPVVPGPSTTASTTGAVTSTTTATTVTAGTVATTVPAATAANLIGPGGTVSVAVSVNDPSKVPAAATAALPALTSTQTIVDTSVTTVTASNVPVKDDSSEVMAKETASAAVMRTYVFEFSTSRTDLTTTKTVGTVSINGGAFQTATITKLSTPGRFSVSFSADVSGSTTFTYVVQVRNDTVATGSN